MIVGRGKTPQSATEPPKLVHNAHLVPLEDRQKQQSIRCQEEKLGDPQVIHSDSREG